MYLYKHTNQNYGGRTSYVCNSWKLCWQMFISLSPGPGLADAKENEELLACDSKLCQCLREVELEQEK